ncbi:unnamed protein product [Caenorhabditis sp. 36 PRJEB53466]|nr:unnamed protein product [Caenorhabditis sp. 36 PRJEB53466]
MAEPVEDSHLNTDPGSSKDPSPLVENEEDGSERSELHKLFMAWLNEKEGDRFENAPEMFDYVHMTFISRGAGKPRGDHNMIEIDGHMIGWYRRKKTIPEVRMELYHPKRSLEESRQLLLQWFNENIDVFDAYKATELLIVLEFIIYPRDEKKFAQKLIGDDSEMFFYIPLEIYDDEDSENDVLFGWIRVPTGEYGQPMKHPDAEMSGRGDHLAFMIRTKRSAKNSKLMQRCSLSDLTEIMNYPAENRIETIKGFAEQNGIGPYEIGSLIGVSKETVTKYFDGVKLPENKYAELKIAMWYSQCVDKPDLLDDCRFELQHRTLDRFKKTTLESKFGFRKPTMEQIAEYAPETEFSLDFLTRFYDRREKIRVHRENCSNRSKKKQTVRSGESVASPSPDRKSAKLEEPTAGCSSQKDEN